jgi:hypothetical protein
MGNQAIPFHLSKTYTTATLPALHWLMGDLIYRASCSHLKYDKNNWLQT